MNDFRIDDDGDLDIDGGDLVSTESTAQHQKSIIWAGKAHFKHAPSIGVGLLSYLNESGGSNKLASAIRQELERDGMTVEAVSIKAGAVTINANYPG
jgi:hypothetical protein